MSRRVVIALLLAYALAACQQDAPAPVAKKTAATEAPLPPVSDNDVDNALNLLYGAALISRGGELDLENSAVHTMDGFDTTWTCAPGAPQDTLVYSMLAPTRIHSIGVTTGDGDDVMDAVVFETSMNGRKWSELATMKPAHTETRQTMEVTPTVAQYLRIRTIEPKKYYVRLRGVHAMGEEVAPPRTPPFGGCWTINGAQAHIEQNGARITGTIAMNPPMYLDGGTDNRAAMVMWIQGPMWGYAVLTRSPDGKHLSGLSFFEEPNVRAIGEGWFGERCESDSRREPTPHPPSAPSPLTRGEGSLEARLFDRTKRYSLFGLAFDPNERLIEELSAPVLDAVVSLLAASPQTRFRFVAHELRYKSPQQNAQHTTARLQALRAALHRRGVDLSRIEFVPAGSNYRGPEIRSALHGALASRIDLLSGT